MVKRSIKRSITVSVLLAGCLGASVIVGSIEPYVITPDSGQTVAANVLFVDPIDTTQFYGFNNFAISSSLGSLTWTLPYFTVEDATYTDSYTFLIPIAEFAFNPGAAGDELDTVTMTEYDLGGNSAFNLASAISTTPLSFQVEVTTDQSFRGNDPPDDAPEPSYFVIGLVLLLWPLVRKNILTRRRYLA